MRGCRHRPDTTRLLALTLLCLGMVRSVGGGGAGGLLGASLVCGRGLTERQRALCHSAPAAVAALGRGLSMAYAECRAQLAGRRWNCSGVGDDPRLGHILPMVGEGHGPPRVQVSRRVGVVRGEDVLARAAPLPAGGRRAPGQVPPRQAGARAARRRCPATTPRGGGRAALPHPQCHEADAATSEKDSERRSSRSQVGAGVPAAVAVVLRARPRRRRARHARTTLQPYGHWRGELLARMLRARLALGAGGVARQVSLPVPLVLHRRLRHLRHAIHCARVQLITGPRYYINATYASTIDDFYVPL